MHATPRVSAEPVSAGDEERWVHPTSCIRPGSAGAFDLSTASNGHPPPVLTAAQISQWRSSGFCVVDGLWPAALIAEAIAQVDEFNAEHADAPT